MEKTTPHYGPKHHENKHYAYIFIHFREFAIKLDVNQFIVHCLNIRSLLLSRIMMRCLLLVSVAVTTITFGQQVTPEVNLNRVDNRAGRFLSFWDFHIS